MKPAPPTAREILTDARYLISTPEAFARGARARDPYGKPVEAEHPHAVAWCAGAAVDLAAQARIGPLHTLQDHLQARSDAIATLNDTVRTLTGGRCVTIAAYNDRTSHGRILHLFDVAISDAPHLTPRRTAP